MLLYTKRTLILTLQLHTKNYTSIGQHSVAAIQANKGLTNARIHANCLLLFITVDTGCLLTISTLMVPTYNALIAAAKKQAGRFQ